MVVVREYLQDFANAERWDPGTVTCTRTDDGPVRVGSRWHTVSKFKGKETELDYRLDRLEPNRLTFVGENKTATSADDLTLTPTGAGTEITYHAHIVFHGFAKVADPFLRSEFEKLGDEVVVSMTDAVDALHTTPGPAGAGPGKVRWCAWQALVPP